MNSSSEYCEQNGPENKVEHQKQTANKSTAISENLNAKNKKKNVRLREKTDHTR